MIGCATESKTPLVAPLEVMTVKNCPVVGVKPEAVVITREPLRAVAPVTCSWPWAPPALVPAMVTASCAPAAGAYPESTLTIPSDRSMVPVSVSEPRARMPPPARTMPAYVAAPAAMTVSAASLLDPTYLVGRARLIDTARAGDPGTARPG